MHRRPSVRCGVSPWNGPRSRCNGIHIAVGLRMVAVRPTRLRPRRGDRRRFRGIAGPASPSQLLSFRMGDQAPLQAPRLTVSLPWPAALVRLDPRRACPPAASVPATALSAAFVLFCFYAHARARGNRSPHFVAGARIVRKRSAGPLPPKRRAPCLPEPCPTLCGTRHCGKLRLRSPRPLLPSGQCSRSRIGRAARVASGTGLPLTARARRFRRGQGVRKRLASGDVDHSMDP